MDLNWYLKSFNDFFSSIKACLASSAIMEVSHQ